MFLALAVALSQPSADVKVAVQSHLDDQLYDGESARWRWFAPKQSPDGTITLCGFLNSKNQLGGYTGFMPVWATARADGTVLDFSIAKGPYLDGVAAKRCTAAGFDMTAIPPR